MKKQQQKRQNKSKQTGTRKSRSLGLTFNPPPSRSMTFVSTNAVDITETAAGLGNWKFLALNNLYDADFAAGGPATAGLSAMSTFYRQYRVNTVRVRLEGYVKCLNAGAVEVCMVPAPTTSTLSSNPAFWPMQRMACSAISTSFTNASGAQRIVLDKTFNIWEIFGVSRAKYEAEDNFSAVFNGSPAVQAYLALTVCGLVGAGGAASFQGRWRVAFDALLYSPVQQTP